MPTPSGQISLSDVNTELGLSATALITMNDAAVRTLAGVGGSGTVITMQDLQGKSNEFNYIISTNQSNLNLATGATAAGWNGTSKLNVTINSGIYIGSTSTGSPALTVSGSFPNTVSLINNGFIIGKGGNGGDGRSINATSGSGGSAGGAGGLALSVSSAITITNNGTFGGGGGGGGGGRAGWDSAQGECDGISVGGGGGGGGRSNPSGNSLAGSGGSAGGFACVSGGSNGGVGTESSAGGGGSGGAFGSARGGNGGSGGDWGASGSGGGNGQFIVNAGGPFSGGGAGGAITGNSNITYISTGTRLGSIT